MTLDEIRPVLGGRTFDTLSRAAAKCEDVSARADVYLSKYVAKVGIPTEEVCFVACGSVGRQEALESSDLDFVPVAGSDAVYEKLVSDNEQLRSGLSDFLGLDVSRGKDLMRTVRLADLTDPLRIGGDKDDRVGLTQRILILTESTQLGGRLGLADVRRQILGAYAAERTAGRHPLAFCNDLARYYRTVCIDYKARVDTTAQDWGTRNVKLRHSRKVWYFSSLIGVAGVSRTARSDTPEFVNEIVGLLEQPPYTRLFASLNAEAMPAAGRMLDQYAWFLEYLANERRRSELASVQHQTRYEISDGNPYPALQWNAKLLHSEMMNVLDRVEPEVRATVLNWFLL